MPSEFLVLYDYGTGGLWAVVMAESADDITTRYPEVTVVPKRPSWMDDALFRKLRDEALRTDSADDEGMFHAVVADRSK